MDFQQFMLALHARRKAFFLVLVATVVAALAAAVLYPKSYRATASLLVDNPDEQSLTSERVPVRERYGYMQTQIDIINSDKVARAVIRNLKLDQLPSVRKEYESETDGRGTIDDWLVGKLQKALRVDTAAGSNLIKIDFDSSSAQVAADVANGYAKAYMAEALARVTGPTAQAADWFEEQLKPLRATVERAQQKLVRYQKQHGIVMAGGDERNDVENAKLADLSTQYLAARNATYDAVAREQEARAALSKGVLAESLPEVIANPFIQGLKTDLAAAEARLQQMRGDYGPNHPEFKRVEAQVNDLRAKLGDEVKKMIGGYESAVAQSRQHENELKRALEAQQNRVLSLKDARIQLAVLQRDADTAYNAYQTALNRLMVNRVESRAQQTNVALLSTARPPIAPRFPQMPTVAGLAALLGILLGLGVVYMLEVLDRRVRSTGELESRLSVPTLGSLSRWQPARGRLLAGPLGAGRALPQPW